MATDETTPRCYRRLKRASDVTAAASCSKRVCMSKEHSSYDQDRISSLPDEMLILILDKLDARTTITTILSKRWLHLPRRPRTCYDFAIDDLLPPRYYRVRQLWMEAKAAYEAEKEPYVASRRDIDPDLTEFYAMKDKMDQWKRTGRLKAAVERYERRAIRCYVKRVDAFLRPPDGVQRTVQKLRLQTFAGGRWNQFIQGWIIAAIARWGVEDFEFSVKDGCICYDFDKLYRFQNVRLKRLTLCNCLPLGLFRPRVFQLKIIIIP
ncbi:uncharacterized protein LOC107303858 [Oryza brachyantha]|uniref:uncharacterized protein LOC107303858 n=1 Tax=Oryza brachyantha TaxID=4533 RepID=UPI00077682E3|nr:uncharacterized protein LOC107303858 [Oryza brachyantha]